MCKQRYDFHLFFAGIAALKVVDAAASVKLLDYEAADFLIVVTYYAHTLALVERVLIANYPPSQELAVTARKMMVAALNDQNFDWSEAERLAALPDFGVLAELRALKEEVSRG